MTAREQFPVSNAAFLSAIFDDLRPDEYLWTTAFAISPERAVGGDWGGQRTRADDCPDYPHGNAYFSVAALKPFGTSVRRQKDNFSWLPVVVLDDVTDCVLTPTYQIETSPGKYHVGFKLTERITDEGVASRLHDELGKNKRIKADTSGNNCVRYMRLPVGCNTKHSPPFPHRLASFDPAVTFTVDELMKALGLDRDYILNGKKPKPPLTPGAPANQKGVVHAGSGARTSYTGRINDAAMANLALWVPSIFPAAREYQGGYRVSSEDLGRDLEEDLTIHPKGIKDFGVHDMGDAQEGKRTPIDLVMEHLNLPVGEAAARLKEALGEAAPADEFGFIDITTGEIHGESVVPDSADSLIPLPEPFRGAMADAVAAALTAAHKPQPELTTLATLIGMAACCEGHYHLPSGARLNLYGTGIAGTGWGKDLPRNVAIEIAKCGGASLIGKPASGQGFEDVLVSYRGVLVEIDEIAHLMEAINGSNKPAYLVELAGVMLRLFSVSSGTYNTRVRAQAKGVMPARAVEHPCISMIGFATPEKLGQALNISNIDDGLIGRQLFAFGRDGVAPRRAVQKLEIPEEVVEAGRQIQSAVTACLFDDTTIYGKTIGIQVEPGANARLDRLIEALDAKARKASTPFAKSMLVRSFEKLERVAGVLAVWENPKFPVMTMEHVDWAEHLIDASDSAALHFCGEYMHGGQVQADAALVKKTIMRILKGEISPQRSGESLIVKEGRAPHSMVLRASKLDKKRFDEAVSHLVDLGEVKKGHVDSVQANGAPHRTQVLVLS